MNLLTDYSLLNMPKSWSELMSPFISTDGFKALGNSLLRRQSNRGVLNYRTAMMPLYMIDPEDVKVVIIANAPVNKYSSPFLWVDNRGKLLPAFKNILSKDRAGLIVQRFDKFSGTNYSTLRKRQFSSTWTDRETYWSLRTKKEKLTNYVGVENFPAFETYNWFRQGVLTLNMNWTSDPKSGGHKDIWNFFNKSLIFQLQRAHKNIVFASGQSAMQDFKCLIDNSHEKLFSNGYNNFFTSINEALKARRGSKLMVNFLIDGFNTKGHSTGDITQRKPGLESTLKLWY